MKSKTSIVLIILFSIIACAFIGGYVILQMFTSDKAIKAIITNALEEATGGKVNIGKTHFNLLKGLSLDNIEFKGKNPEKLRILADSILVRHNPIALLRGEIVIDSATIMSPEFFIVREKGAIWKFLNGLKTFLDKSKIACSTDHLRNGIDLKGIKVHFFDAKIFREGTLDINGMNLLIQPFGGSLRKIYVKGNIYDDFWGDMNVDIGIDLNIPKLKLTAKLRNKIMTEALMREVPAFGEMIWKNYSPEGKFNFDCILDLNNENGLKKVNYAIKVNAIDGNITYIKWPFPVKHVNGLFEISEDGMFLKNLKGDIQNEGRVSKGEIDAFFSIGNSRKHVKINISNFDITKKLTEMVPGIGEGIWEDYKPEGKLDVDITYKSNKDKSVTDYSIEAICKGVEVSYPAVPFRLRDITGLIQLDKENIYFRNINGNFLNGDRINRTTFDGVLNLKNKEKQFTVSIPNLNLTEEIFKCIPEGKGDEIWSNYRPGGKVDITVDYIEENDSSGSDYVVTVDCKGSEIMYNDLPLKVSDIVGTIVIDKENIQLKNLSGYAVTGDQSSRISCKAEFGLNNKNKKLLLDVVDIRVNQDLIDKLPDSFKNKWLQLQPEGWVDINLNYNNSIGHNDDYSIIIDTKGCKLGFSNSPIMISNIDSRISIERKMLNVQKFDGTCDEGKVYGSVRYDMSSPNGEYNGKLRFENVNLEKLIEEYLKTDQNWTGTCEGKIKFSGEGGKLETFTAEGQAKIREGNLYEFPALLSIFNLLNLTIPKKDSFHSADVKYLVKDRTFEIDKFQLLSDTVELVGIGKVGFDGTLDLTIVAGFNQETFSSIPLIGQLMDFVVGGVRKKLTKVQITGTFSEPQSSMIGLRPFTQPIKNVFGLLTKGGVRNEESNGKEVINGPVVRE